VHRSRVWSEDANVGALGSAADFSASVITPAVRTDQSHCRMRTAQVVDSRRCGVVLSIVSNKVLRYGRESGPVKEAGS